MPHRGVMHSGIDVRVQRFATGYLQRGQPRLLDLPSEARRAAATEDEQHANRAQCREETGPVGSTSPAPNPTGTPLGRWSVQEIP